MANFIKGIDVSHYEPNIAWDQLLGQDIRFVYMKATQGTTYFDPFYPGFWAKAKEHGILHGAYHLIDPRLDGETQARFFLQKTGTTYDPGDLPPVLDLEDFDDVDPSTGGKKGQRSPSRGRGKSASNAKVTSTRDASSAQVIRCVEAWLRYVENNTTPKQTPILYSTADYFKSRLSNPATVSPSWASNYPVWVAHYPNPMTEAPLEASGWSSWTFWQYSKNGQVQGITDQLGRLTGVDLNYFKGTLAELYALARTTPPVDVVVDQPQAGTQPNAA